MPGWRRRRRFKPAAPSGAPRRERPSSRFPWVKTQKRRAGGTGNLWDWLATSIKLLGSSGWAQKQLRAPVGAVLNCGRCPRALWRGARRHVQLHTQFPLIRLALGQLARPMAWHSGPTNARSAEQQALELRAQASYGDSDRQPACDQLGGRVRAKPASARLAFSTGSGGSRLRFEASTGSTSALEVCIFSSPLYFIWK